MSTLHTLVCQIPLTHFIPWYVKYLLYTSYLGMSNTSDTLHTFVCQIPITHYYLCFHWPCTMEPASSFDSFLFINWWATCLFSLSQDLFFPLGLSQWQRLSLLCTERSAI